MPLPASQQERIMALVRRSAPRKRDNRLPDQYEKLYQKTDTELAACYASIDDLDDRFDQVIDAIDDESEGVVVDEFETFEDISTVRHIHEARRSIDTMHALLPPAPPLPPTPGSKADDDYSK
jgi:Mg2+ and Co2+ transporter CorA